MRLAEPDPDLVALPDQVRAAAHVFANGEVAWPNSVVEAAINALAMNGKLITGLDARTLSAGGGITEVPVSAWQADAAESPRLPSSALNGRHSTRFPRLNRRAPTS